MYDFYIAGPLFTQAERNFNATLSGILKRAGYNVFLPQLSILENPPDIFRYNLINLRTSNALIVICDGADMDSGTAWEGGRFYGHGKIYALRTDFRKSADDPVHGFNLMISQSADHFFTDRKYMCEWIIKNVRRK